MSDIANFFNGFNEFNIIVTSLKNMFYLEEEDALTKGMELYHTLIAEGILSLPDIDHMDQLELDIKSIVGELDGSEGN